MTNAALLYLVMNCWIHPIVALLNKQSTYLNKHYKRYIDPIAVILKTKDPN